MYTNTCAVIKAKPSLRRQVVLRYYLLGCSGAEALLFWNASLNHSNFWSGWWIVISHPVAVWCQGKLNFLNAPFKHPLRKMALNFNTRWRLLKCKTSQGSRADDCFSQTKDEWVSWSCFWICPHMEEVDPPKIWKATVSRLYIPEQSGEIF